MKKLILILAMFIAVPGCALLPLAPALGPIIQGYLMWKDGEASAYYETDAQTAYNAVKRVMKEIEAPILEDEHPSGREFYIKSENIDSFKVTIEQKEGLEITRISIRINFMGDKKYVELIYKKLESQLDVIVFDPETKKFKRFKQ